MSSKIERVKRPLTELELAELQRRKDNASANTKIRALKETLKGIKYCYNLLKETNLTKCVGHKDIKNRDSMGLALTTLSDERRRILSQISVLEAGKKEKCLPKS